MNKKAVSIVRAIQNESPVLIKARIAACLEQKAETRLQAKRDELAKGLIKEK